jgi:hypothetical protein
MDYINWIDRHLRDGLQAIGANKRAIVIMSSSYNTGIDTAKCAAQFGEQDAKCIPETLDKAQKSTAAIDGMLRNLVPAFPRLTILDPKSSFCDTTRCVTRDNGLPLFRDAIHLTNEGSAYLIDRLKPAFLSALKPKNQGPDS